MDQIRFEPYIFNTSQNSFEKNSRINYEETTQKFIKTIQIVRCSKYLYKEYNDHLNRIMFDIVRSNIV